MKACVRPLGLLVCLCLWAPAARAFTVAIDPGHGGIKDGARSPFGTREKNVALALAKELKKQLEEEPGVKTVLTRDSDIHVELPDRTKMANDTHADLLISIHCNSMETSAGRSETMGVETYFLSPDATDPRAQALAAMENADITPKEETAADPISAILQDLSRMEAHADSKRLAEQVHQTLVKSTGTKDRGVRQAPFLVLLGAEMPAILVEVGFISHPTEGRKLSKPAYQEKVAGALKAAILSFRDNVYAKRAAPEPAPMVVPAASTAHLP